MSYRWFAVRGDFGTGNLEKVQLHQLIEGKCRTVLAAERARKIRLLSAALMGVQPEDVMSHIVGNSTVKQSRFCASGMMSSTELSTILPEFVPELETVNYAFHDPAIRSQLVTFQPHQISSLVTISNDFSKHTRGDSPGSVFLGVRYAPLQETPSDNACDLLK